MNECSEVDRNTTCQNCSHLAGDHAVNGDEYDAYYGPCLVEGCRCDDFEGAEA